MKKNCTLLKSLALLVGVLWAGGSQARNSTVPDSLQTIHSQTILFVTGAFVTSNCWDEWQGWFKAKGFKTSAPAWPFKDGTAAELRERRPHDTLLARLTLDSVINYYEALARQCKEKPILIGHSLGGLIVQVLVNRGVAAAGIAIHSVPPKGVLPYERSSVRSITAALGVFTSRKKTYMMSYDTWQYAFTNGMTPEVQKQTYQDFTIPESKTAARGALSKAAYVDFKRSHVPLLLTSGSDDNILPAHLNRRNYERYSSNGSVLSYKEFSGRNHFVLGQPTWKEDAEFIFQWIKQYSDNTHSSLTGL